MSVRVLEENIELKKTFLEKDFEEIYKEIPLNDDTQCGFYGYKAPLLQKFASKKLYVLMHGLVGCLVVSSFAYFTGTITTLEKLFKIPSQNTGIITVSYDIASIFMGPILCHYLAKSHRPRWIGFGALTTAIYCFMMGFLHFLYGPGDNAFTLTAEFRTLSGQNATKTVLEEQQENILCQLDASDGADCETSSGSLFPQIYLFTVNFMEGIFGPIYDCLGTAYMDDNIQKSKTPVLISLSYAIRMLGPALGYTVASYSLNYYISPSLTPMIKPTDSRWLGAYWLGWFIIGSILTGFSIIIGCFPKKMPRESVRRMILVEKEKLTAAMDEIADENNLSKTEKKVDGIVVTFKRILSNKILMLNTIASIFYFFGALPYWLFTPKYIETQYRQSAAQSNFLTGTTALLFTALGIFVAGIVLTKLKPKARSIAAWDVVVGASSAIVMIGYIFMGCSSNDKSIIFDQPLFENSSESCMSNCHCDFVKYSPVCGVDGNTYISPCHAGCTKEFQYKNGTKYFENCSCIETNVNKLENLLFYDKIEGGSAADGLCPVNCYRELIIFMIAMCFNQFMGSTGRASNFLISVRCVDEDDKSVSLGIVSTILGIFTFVPSPIIFGWIIDQACVVWGKTCLGTGNCWLYDGEKLRYTVNLTAAIMVALGTICDCFVWYFVKDLKIFDDNNDNSDYKIADKCIVNENDVCNINILINKEHS